MFLQIAEWRDTPESKDRRNGEYKACLHERAILRLLDHVVTGAQEETSRLSIRVQPATREAPRRLFTRNR